MLTENEVKAYILDVHMHNISVSVSDVECWMDVLLFSVLLLLSSCVLAASSARVKTPHLHPQVLVSSSAEGFAAALLRLAHTTNALLTSHTHTCNYSYTHTHTVRTKARTHTAAAHAD